MLFTLAVVAIALPATWTTAHAQSQVQIEYFRASVHPARNIVRLVWRMSEDTALPLLWLRTASTTSRLPQSEKCLLCSLVVTAQIMSSGM